MIVDLDDRMTLANAEGIDLDLSLAGIGSRGSAVLIDLALQFLVSLVVLAVGLSYGGFGVAFAAIFSFLILLGYPILAEGFASGRTVGKAVMRIAVVSVDGTPVPFLAAVIRNVIRVVDLLPGAYFVGIVSVLVTDRNQRVGDLAAGTIVVHTGRPRVADPGFAMMGTLPPESAGWDVSGVTVDEVAAVRSFLIRRGELDQRHRADLAQTLAFQILPKVAGVPLEGGPELFLERIVAVKMAR